MSKEKVETFLEKKAAHTKYSLFRLKYNRLKVIAFDINEIWSVDLAYVEKLAKYNKGVKYLMIAVDVLSRYLRVAVMRSLYTHESTRAFKTLIKNKQPQKVWTDGGPEFQKHFKQLCNKKGIELYKTQSEKKSVFAERYIRTLKNIIYKYLEEEWTWSYLGNLDQFVRTINTRVNRVTKIAPSKVTKKDVPRLVALTVEQSKKLLKKPKFKVGDFVRLLKQDKAFRKGYKQNFTDEVFEIVEIPTLNPPTYVLVDANREPIGGKYYEVELRKVGDINDE